MKRNFIMKVVSCPEQFALRSPTLKDDFFFSKLIKSVICSEDVITN